MNGSIKIGSVLGITVRVHVLLLVLAGFLVFGARAAGPHGPWAQAIQLAMLFGIILLHELAHSVVAMRFGLKVVDITLWPLGGMARMSEMPESSRVEGLVAIAGPLLNFALAALALPVWLWSLTSDSAPAFLPTLSGLFLWWNLTLGGFNLLPAFPMDGGRILRAFLGRKGDWVRATERAVRIGRGVAFLLGMLGVLTFPWFGVQSILFVLVALFVWWAGTQELLAVRARHGLDPLAAFREFAARATGWSQTQAASEYARGPAADPPPLRQDPPAAGGDARARARQGFSESEIERLERFHGPLRTFRPEDA
jgi:Zn-dependent protease